MELGRGWFLHMVSMVKTASNQNSLFMSRDSVGFHGIGNEDLRNIRAPTTGFGTIVNGEFVLLAQRWHAGTVLP